jgi:hypothetical protein
MKGSRLNYSGCRIQDKKMEISQRPKTWRNVEEQKREYVKEKQ